MNTYNIYSLLLLSLLNKYSPAGSGSDCSNIELKTDQDASLYSDCKEAGKITIGPNVQKLQFAAVEKADSIEGSKSESLKSVEFGNLKQVDNLSFDNNRGLETINMPNLKESKGINIIGNPVLQSVKMALNKVGQMEIINNGVSKLEGFNNIKELTSLTLSSNPNLDKFITKMVEKMEGYLFVSGNNPKLQFDMPSLQSIGGNVTISNTTAVDLGGLYSIDNLVNIVGNHFKEFNLKNLTTVSSSFSFVSNDLVEALELSNLQQIGGALLISNNTNLKEIKFDKLEELRGTLDVTGDFKTLELPSLNMIVGGANVQSKDGSLECDKLSNVKSITSGKFQCEGKVKDPQAKISSNSTSKSNKDNSSSKKIELYSALSLVGFFGLISFDLH